MTPDERFPDDAVLRRVAAARPAMREEDLSPTSERATAIADKVLRTRRPADAGRSRARTRWSRRTRRRPVVLGTLGLTAAAACVALLIIAVLSGSSSNNGQAMADVIKIQLTAAPEPRSMQLAMSRTPLGAQIAREHRAVLLNLRTGNVAQNRKPSRSSCVTRRPATRR
jgi:hypothetical protein